MKPETSDAIITSELSKQSFPPKEKPILCPISLDDLINKQFSETAWIVEQLLPAEGITALSGLPGEYKTWIILELGLRVATGTMLFDKYKTTKTSVLYIDEESGERELQKRSRMLQTGENAQLYVLSKTGFKLTPETVKQLIAYCKRNSVGLIIFDSLIRIHTAHDENDAIQMARVFTLFQQLTKHGITVLFVHHSRKLSSFRTNNPSQDLRGSSDILAAVDCHLAVNFIRNERCVQITQTKLREGLEAKPIKLAINTEVNDFRFTYQGDVEETQTKKDDIKEAIRTVLSDNDSLNKTELYKQIKSLEIDGGFSTYKTAVNELVKDGELTEQKGEKNSTYISLKNVTKGDI